MAKAVLESEAPFGGLQLVLCGDFLQLPPVSVLVLVLVLVLTADYSTLHSRQRTTVRFIVESCAPPLPPCPRATVSRTPVRA